jgi:hypothetical protein
LKLSCTPRDTDSNSRRGTIPQPLSTRFPAARFIKSAIGDIACHIPGRVDFRLRRRRIRMAVTPSGVRVTMGSSRGRRPVGAKPDL